jgi:hypothetical protein
MDAGATASGLAMPLLQAAVDAWQSEGASDEGVFVMREAHSWLHSQLQADLRQTPPVYAPRTMAAVAALGDMIAVLDGATPSLDKLMEIRQYIDLDKDGRAVFQGAAVAALCAYVPGMPEEAMWPLFDGWWGGQTGTPQFVQTVTACVARECKDENAKRIAATWGGEKPQDGYYPSFRLDDKMSGKVPWFLPMWAIEAAAEVDPAARRAEERVLSGGDPELWEPVEEPKNHFGETPGRVAMRAKALTNGRCIYCGSAHALTVRCIFPAALGGGDKHDTGNFGEVCPVCLEWKSKLGPKLWHKVLRAPPEEVAETWWEAQRKANEKVADFLERAKEEKAERLSSAIPQGR